MVAKESKALILQKIASIERCVSRVLEEYCRDDLPFVSNFSAQDAAILNIQRACEQVFDLTNHLIRVKAWGSPASRGAAMDILVEKGIIDDALALRLKKMNGFRNLAVHEYQKLNLDILVSIIEDHMVDFENFNKAVLGYLKESGLE